MAVIKIPVGVREEVFQHLFTKSGEHFGFLSADAYPSADGPVFLVREFLPIRDELVAFSKGGWEVHTEAILEVVNHAVLNQRALIEVHNHALGVAQFSPIDRNGLEQFVPYILDSLPGRPYGATVWTSSDIYGEYFETSAQGTPVRSITTVGTSFTQLNCAPGSAVPDPRFIRQESWLTSAGQTALGQLRIGIVGLGGTGSLVAQNLAYLGIQDFVLVDDDDAEESNMNRLVTASFADIETPKTILGHRLIRRINPKASVRILTTDLRTRSVFSQLKEVDVIFGCVDNDGARLVLNELCRAYHIPLFDLGVGLDAEDGKVISAGGRVVSVIPEGPCLQCLGEIDQNEARYFLSSSKDQEVEHRLGYVEGLDVAAAAVISLNATIASIAVNEFIVFLTGARPLNYLLDYDMLGNAHSVPSQRLGPRTVSRKTGCVQCSIEGQGDEAQIERYIIANKTGES